MNDKTNRFIDSNLSLSDFSDKTLVACPQCGKRAEVIGNHTKTPVLICYSCHYKNEQPQGTKEYNPTIHSEFGVEFWLQASFKNELLWFHNHEQMAYVKRYIQADIRERNNREFFTLVEKLPQFIKSAKNRDRLLKLIEKLEKK
jgi:hypothetical protein